ncbi:MAG: hypothetical protein R3Y43_07165 [Alphaproteobacteria bacterium]
MDLEQQKHSISTIKFALMSLYNKYSVDMQKDTKRALFYEKRRKQIQKDIKYLDSEALREKFNNFYLPIIKGEV